MKVSIPILAEKERRMWKSFFWASSKNKSRSQSPAIARESLLQLFPVDFDESFEHIGCSCELYLPKYCNTSKTKPQYQLLTLIGMKLLGSLTKCSADLGFLYCACFWLR